MNKLFSFSLKVPPSDLDDIYHHVDHAQALKYLEKGRLEYLASIGFPAKWFIAQGVFPVVTRVDAKYKREIFGETLMVTVNKVSLEGKKFFIFQEIIKENGKIAIEATIESAFMHGPSKRAITPPVQFIDFFR